MSEAAASTTAVADSTTALRKPPSVRSAARARVYKWSRRIMITTESLWLKKIRRNKFKTFVYIFLPSVFIFLLAFSLAPAKGASDNNNLLFGMGGILQPTIMITAGVVPKRIHSRRDSFGVRYTPLLSALGYGATSLEIYLWLKPDNTLCVGAHNPDEQEAYELTLGEIYLESLKKMLEFTNLPDQNVTRGVFQTAPYLPLQLVFNVMPPGPPPPDPDTVQKTLEALDIALQPFLQAGWLTTLDTRNSYARPQWSALTVVITGGGNPPGMMVNPNSPPDPIRYMFFDAPLMELGEDSGYPPTFTPMASASFSSLVGARWMVPRLAKKRIRHYVQKAHSMGIAVRITEPIDFPVWIRNMYWQILLDCGVDWLDVDDLYSASKF